MRSMLDQQPPVSGMPPRRRRMYSRVRHSEESRVPCSEAHPEKAMIASKAKIASGRNIRAISTPPTLRIKE
jgi:hypothetical protein